MKKIQCKLRLWSVNKIFPIISLWDFFKRSKAANSAVRGPIRHKFELVQDFMVVLLTWKYEEDPIKDKSARVLTILYVVFSDAQGLRSKRWNSAKFELIQSFMVVLVT